MKATSPVLQSHAPVLTIDLSALAANWRLLADRAAPGACGAVVKADAYGLGIEVAVPALQAAGCRNFFVAHLAEAARARAVAAGAELYVLNGLASGEIAAYSALGARPVLGSIAEIDFWIQASEDQPSLPAPALHVDTGMNRLGLAQAEFDAILGDGRFARLGPHLVLSHLVEAEIPGSTMTMAQIRRFGAIEAAIIASDAKISRLSLCNSAGIFLENRPNHGLSRPGYALYGGNPTPGKANPMQAVIRLEAPIIQLNAVRKGEPVGYNQNFIAQRDSLIATISCGYADGYPRNAGSKPGAPGGLAIVAGREVPFAGNVSMDLITLDITDLPAGSVSPGDRAVLIGDGLDLDRVGAGAKTIGYEILTNLGRRHQRRVIGGQ